jgi:flagellar secretion chaperone FliS
MIPAGYGRYAKAAVAVQKKEDILLLLLDTAAMDLKKARMGIEDHSPKVKGESISRAISLLTELDCALDHDTGKDLTDNLSRLYHFIMDRLTLANLKNDLTALDEADQVLGHLHDGFKQAVKTQKGGQGPAQVASCESDGEETPAASRVFSIAV